MSEEVKTNDQEQKFTTYKKIKLEDMMDYIEANAPQDKAWFKSICFDENGRYVSHLKIIKIFCEKYMPNLLVHSKKVKAKDRLANW